MATLREFLHRLWGSLRRNAKDREIEEELRAHLELANAAARQCLAALWHTAPGLGVTGDLSCSPSIYFTYRENGRVFQYLRLWSSGGTTVTGAGDPEQVRTLWVTYGVLQALGVRSLLGRWFSEADDSPAGTDPAPVILTYAYWQRRFGGDRSVIGRTITVDSRLNQIAGVMPADFRFYGFDPELIQTLGFDTGIKVTSATSASRASSG
jgi:hypothetical protein